MQPRRASLDEYEAITDVWLRSRTASVPAIPAPVHSDDEVRAYFRDVVLPTKEVWVVDGDSAVIALLVLEDDWIDQLYVDPDSVGTGVGSSLLAIAKAERPSGLTLWTFASNTDARRFYEHRGFVATATTDGDNEEGAPDVRYEWRP